MLFVILWLSLIFVLSLLGWLSWVGWTLWTLLLSFTFLSLCFDELELLLLFELLFELDLDDEYLLRELELELRLFLLLSLSLWLYLECDRLLLWCLRRLLSLLDDSELFDEDEYELYEEERRLLLNRLFGQFRSICPFSPQL